MLDSAVGLILGNIPATLYGCSWAWSEAVYHQETLKV